MRLENYVDARCIEAAAKVQDEADAKIRAAEREKEKAERERKKAEKEKEEAEKEKEKAEREKEEAEREKEKVELRRQELEQKLKEAQTEIRRLRCRIANSYLPKHHIICTIKYLTAYKKDPTKCHDIPHFTGSCFCV